MFLMSCYHGFQHQHGRLSQYVKQASHGISEYSQGPLEFISATRFWVFYAHCLPLIFWDHHHHLQFSLQNRRCENIPVYGVIMTHVRIMRWREESLEQWHSAAAMILNFGAAQVGELSRGLGTLTRRKLELQTNLCEDQSFTITKNAPSRAFSWFKAPKDVMGCNGMLTQRS